ncbi:MAG: hypothetical protein RQ869_01355 [Candidatus Nanopusillus sp.]|nr:hypothetical protein [Candidatus Nanopusillus sp.]
MDGQNQNKKFYKTSLDGLLEGTLEVMKDESKFPYFSLLLGSIGKFNKLLRGAKYQHPIVDFERQQLLKEIIKLIEKYLDIEPDPLTFIAGLSIIGYAQNGYKVEVMRCRERTDDDECWYETISYTKGELAEEIGSILIEYATNMLRDKYYSKREIENIRRNLNEIVNTIAGTKPYDINWALGLLYRAIGLMYIEKLKKLGIAKEESGEQYKIIIDEKKLMEMYRPLIQSRLTDEIIEAFKYTIAEGSSAKVTDDKEIYNQIEEDLKKDPKYKMCIETMPKCRINVWERD